MKYLLSQGALTQTQNAGGRYPIDCAQESLDLIRVGMFEQNYKASNFTSLTKTQQIETAHRTIDNLESIKMVLAQHAPKKEDSSAN